MKNNLPPIETTFEYKRIKQILDRSAPDRLEELSKMIETGFNDDRKTVSVTEFAKVTGISATTIRRWCEAGTIKSNKIGRNWLIPIGELERVIDPEQ